MATVLSIQSAVAEGSVGNSVAAFVLMALGHEVVRLDTVQLSNHPGHGGFTGGPVPAERLAALADGLAAHGSFGRLDAVLTGYLGSPENGPVLESVLLRAREGGRQPLIIMDPVIGDDGRIFVADGIPEWFAGTGIAQADWLTPNAFELGHFMQRRVGTVVEAAEAARLLLARGPETVIVTGVPDGEALAVVAVSSEAAWVVRHDRIRGRFDGCGDLFAALLTGHALLGPGAALPEGLPGILARATGATLAVLQETRAQGRRELAFVAARRSLEAPSRLPAVTRI